MLYKEFCKVIKLLKECVKVQEDCTKVLRTDIYEEHNILITELLKLIYNEYSVTYILNEWLCGNKNPIKFKSNEGVEVDIPLNTMRDLWKAMETYGTVKE